MLFRRKNKGPTKWTIFSTTCVLFTILVLNWVTWSLYSSKIVRDFLNLVQFKKKKKKINNK